jgi:hypothetical protein
MGGETNEPTNNAKVYIQVLAKAFHYNASSKEPSYIGLHFEAIRAKTIN